MSWFAAHLVLFVKLKDKRQRRFPVWENIVLIRADSEALALEKAEQRGREEEGDDDGTFRWGGQKAQWVFAGVRKLTMCEDSESRPSDGTEISYLELELDSQDAVAQLMAGRPVPMRYREKFRGKPVAYSPENVNHRRRRPA
jgi:hypothetical protein